MVADCASVTASHCALPLALLYTMQYAGGIMPITPTFLIIIGRGEQDTGAAAAIGSSLAF